MEGMMSLLYFFRLVVASWAHFEPAPPPLSMDTNNSVLMRFEACADQTLTITWNAVSNTCGRGWVSVAFHGRDRWISALSRLRNYYPPATAGGTDFMPLRKSTCFSRVTRAQPLGRKWRTLSALRRVTLVLPI